MAARSLDHAVVEAIARAAANGQFVVVPHLLDAKDVDCSDDDLDLLAAEMPPAWIRGVDGGVDLFQGNAPAEFGHILPQHRDGPTVARIYHVQRSRRYRALIGSICDPLERGWPSSEPWLERDAGIFLGSGRSVTPAHSDQHHNLLLQVTGTKEVGVLTPGSRAHAAAVTRSHAGGLWVDEMPSGAEVFRLTPRSALYLPPYAIHWVRNLDRTVAISCAWSSAATVRSGEVYAAKSLLSRAGIPIQSRGAIRDRVSLGAVRVTRRLKRAHNAVD